VKGRGGEGKEGKARVCRRGRKKGRGGKGKGEGGRRNRGRAKENGDRPPTIFGLKVALPSYGGGT